MLHNPSLQNPADNKAQDITSNPQKKDCPVTNQKRSPDSWQAADDNDKCFALNIIADNKARERCKEDYAKNHRHNYQGQAFHHFTFLTFVFFFVLTGTAFTGSAKQISRKETHLSAQ